VGSDFLIGETIDGCRYRLIEQLLAGGAHRLYLADAPASPDERYLVSVNWTPRGVPADEMWRELGYRIPGVLELMHIGHFDIEGDEYLRNQRQQHHWSLVERVPAGDWLPRTVKGPLGARAAAALGLSVGRILERAASEGRLLVGVRPEYIWVARRGDDLEAVGVSERYRALFARAGGNTSTPGTMLVSRSYRAPEVREGRWTEDEALVFSLAVMIAEWATGAYPFEDTTAFLAGRHKPLDVPDVLGKLLASCFKVEWMHRPSLPYFLKRLALLANEK
jgi:hypothetical protein